MTDDNMFEGRSPMICKDCFCGMERKYENAIPEYICLLDNAQIFTNIVECSRHRSKEETEKTSANAVREEIKEQGKPVNEEDPHWKYSGL